MPLAKKQVQSSTNNLEKTTRMTVKCYIPIKALEDEGESKESGLIIFMTELCSMCSWVPFSSTTSVSILASNFYGDWYHHHHLLGPSEPFDERHFTRVINTRKIRQIASYKRRKTGKHKATTELQWNKYEKSKSIMKVLCRNTTTTASI